MFHPTFQVTSWRSGSTAEVARDQPAAPAERPWPRRIRSKSNPRGVELPYWRRLQIHFVLWPKSKGKDGIAKGWNLMIKHFGMGGFLIESHGSFFFEKESKIATRKHPKS